jgi:hypothetical protein
LRLSEQKFARPALRENRRLFHLAFLVLLACAACPQFARACDQVPAGGTFRIRLLQPVASYSSKPGTLVRGFIIESPVCAGAPAFAAGTLVEGHIVSVQKVGLGFRHETSKLQIEFDRVLENDIPVEIHARVLAVDNAREKVKNGVIRGAPITNTPHGYLGDTLGTFLMWHPASFWIVPAAGAAFSVLPEPELYLPSGADLLLQLTAPVTLAEGDFLAPARGEFAAPDKAVLDEQVLSLPARTSTPKSVDADVVNLAFLGSQDQLERAFQSAGWLSSDASSKRNIFHQYRAFVLSHSYPQGPMSQQLLEGHASDFNWEKGLDSVAKRDHLRVWSDSLTLQGSPVWLGASTRDVGIRLMLRNGTFTHRVEPDIDVERERIVRDLSLAGCVESVYNAPRAAMPGSLLNSTGDKLRTDGAVAVVQLKDCEAPDLTDDASSSAVLTRPPTKLARFVRLQVLSLRGIWRENAAYNVFDLSRLAVRSLHRKYEASRKSNTPAPQSAFSQSATVPN